MDIKHCDVCKAHINKVDRYGFYHKYERTGMVAGQDTAVFLRVSAYRHWQVSDGYEELDLCLKCLMGAVLGVLPMWVRRINESSC